MKPLHGADNEALRSCAGFVWFGIRINLFLPAAAIGNLPE
jgi:hypothetical protein